VLAALIIADEDGAEAGSALVPILGQPLVELQVRQAHAAGAGHIVICTAQVPAGLVAALDRLRADAINVAIVRSAREAADSIHPDEAVLLIGQGCAATTDLIHQMAAGDNSLVAVEPLDPRSHRQELIDAQHGWAGLARIDGSLVRKTSQIPGDWALGPTLLRLAIQAGAGRFNVATEKGSRVRHIVTSADAGLAARDFLSGSVSKGGEGSVAAIVKPIGTLIAQQLGLFNAPVSIVAAIPLALLLLAITAGLLGWSIAAFSLFLLSIFPGFAAQTLIEATIKKSRILGAFWSLRPWIGRIILIGFGWSTMTQGWGREALILALWLVWMLWDGRDEEGVWRSDEDSAILFCLGGSTMGFPVIGVAAAIFHAAFNRVLPRLWAKSPVSLG
jgi:hypothetical protein